MTPLGIGRPPAVDDGYEGAPSDDFIGRAHGWEWPADWLLAFAALGGRLYLRPNIAMCDDTRLDVDDTSH